MALRTLVEDVYADVPLHLRKQYNAFITIAERLGAQGLILDPRAFVFLSNERDIGTRFLSDDGTISAEIMYDHLHPTSRGYAIWAEAMEPAKTSLYLNFCTRMSGA